MRLGRRHVLAGLELGEPGIGFRARYMEAGGLVFGPRRHRIAPEPLAFFLAREVLLDRFAPANATSAAAPPRAFSRAT